MKHSVVHGYSNLEKFLQMQEVLETVQLVTSSLSVDVASLCK